MTSSSNDTAQLAEVSIEDEVVGIDHDDESETTGSNQNESQQKIDSLEHRVQQIADTLFIYDERAWFLAAMFNADFYSATYGLEALPKEQLFTHFLAEGVQLDHSPSPAFDPVYAREQLVAVNSTNGTKSNINEGDVSSSFMQWLNNSFTSIEPHALFNGEFYINQYADLTESVSNPYAHFATTGIYENRIPCEFLKSHVNTLYTKFNKTQACIEDIFCSIPVGFSSLFLKQETQIVFKKIFMPELYKQQLGLDVEISDADLYSHYLVKGAIDDLRPTVLFNSKWYSEKLDAFKLSDSPTETLREFRALAEKEIAQLKIIGSSSGFFHWYFNGMKLGIVPTPLFDTEHYTNAHPDIGNNWMKHPFLHFIETGYAEPFRHHSTMFEANFYREAIKGLKFNNALLDFTLRGQFENVSPANGLDLTYFSAPDPLRSSLIEEAARFFDKRLQKLQSGVVSDMVEKATALEPQVVRPYGVRHVRMAPVFHPETNVMRDMDQIVPELSKTNYDAIVLMPHCRLAGSANVAGQFTKSLSQLSGVGDVLVITTDSSTFERPDWFPSNVDVFDISKYTSGLRQERKIRILLDLVRGLRPKRLVNINSNLGWHLTHTFGKQLSAWMQIYFYLFCWDRDYKGNKGGYPIQWFLPTFNYASAVFTDNTALRSELQDRYCLTDDMRQKIVTLHTPAAETDVNYYTALRQRVNNKGIKRIFWSGRFDHQKRLDILFAVANRLPDIEFWIWGKAVLNDSKVNVKNAPENVRIMGTYQSIDDLPVASCDLFLYTSGWDGLPIILIDVATRGIPIVASRVGGVGDLINENTGWPVDDYAAPDAYCKAINEILSDYQTALEKAQTGREHALSLCDEEKYNGTLRQSLQTTNQNTI